MLVSFIAILTNKERTLLYKYTAICDNFSHIRYQNCKNEYEYILPQAFMMITCFNKYPIVKNLSLSQ